MQDVKIIQGENEDAVWQQLTTDLAKDEILEYRALIDQGKERIVLDIDIDLGGGFESGYATTRLTAPLQTLSDFRFAIHEENFLDEAGKFFGMQDVVIGYPEFDEKFIIKTNNEAKVKALFSDSNIREVLQSLTHFTLQIALHNEQDSDTKKPFLELHIEEGITDPIELRKIYHAFYTILTAVDTV